MAETKISLHPMAAQRARLGWSQVELARRAGLPRSSVGAMESRALTPSVTAALAVAQALGCSAEELFAAPSRPMVAAGPVWTSPPGPEPVRYWEAELNGRRVFTPVENISLNPTRHDGVWRGGVARGPAPEAAGTLLVACCDPAAGLLAGEYARATGYRLIVLPRGGHEALTLLQRGLVHMAGLHRATPHQPNRNRETVRAQLGGGHQLLRVADWTSGLAVAAAMKSPSTRKVTRQARRWALREPGSAARECLDTLTPSASGRTVFSHAAVAEAVRSGWADTGVCVQLSAWEAKLGFVPVRQEALDLCFADVHQHDPRIRALVRLVRSRAYRELLGDLPGYDVRASGELVAA